MNLIKHMMKFEEDSILLKKTVLLKNLLNWMTVKIFKNDKLYKKGIHYFVVVVNLALRNKDKIFHVGYTPRGAPL